MPKVDQITKAERKERVFLTLRRYPLGLSVMELSEMTGIERRTLDNYLTELEREGKVYKEEKSPLWVALPYEQMQLRKFELSPEEAMTLYLAARLFTKQHDKRNEPAETALMKLATALASDANIGHEIHQAALELSHRPDAGDYNKVFRAVMQAYIYRRVLHITYEPGYGRPFETDFSPYLLEPSAVGFTTYAIGHSSIVNDWRTYKLERIRVATLTRQEYRIPADFPGLDILQSAWSIIWGEKVERVVLRFSPAVHKRVMETRWHPSEDKKDDPEKPGHLLWTAEVADTLDMLPWVRGWGADVEVLEPESLRKTLEGETKRLAKLYHLTETKEKPIAHIRKKDKDCNDPQYLWEHLSEASVLAKQFAGKIGLDKSGEVLGLLHDLGKASAEFQNYIRSANGLIDPDEDGYTDVAAKKGKVDHSSAGAQVVYKHLWEKGSEGRIAAQVLSLPIASHHSGLIDCLSPNGADNFTRRIEKPEESTHVSEALSNLDEQEKQALEKLLADDVLVKQLIEKLKSLKEENDHQDTLMFKYGLLVRFLFSCVIDADRLNTADFEFPKNSQIRNYGNYHPWETLLQRLDTKLSEFENKAEKNEVDELRSQVSQACLEYSAKPKGIYQLKVPTGGGKTLASLRFALNHAAQHKMDRIFYVIPYTSIIDQNADEVRKILEDRDENGQFLDKVVLEHHSNLTPEEETKRQNLLAENWDAPVVFTTQVQFLEALFGSGTRGARRMHQLANSVIIFDEIQTLPIRVVHMFNLAIRFLVNNCDATVVLCSATQPLLDKVEPAQRALSITPERCIIQHEVELFEKLKRVEVFDGRKTGGWTDEDVAERVEHELWEKGSVLVIVNTRRSARSLYQTIAEEKLAEVYHLSTNMCPAHRLKVLDEVKTKLGKEPVICVSTQLIEAGVDIDFGSVIRYLAGLDSIIQAAGRCNRHGRQTSGNMWIVNPNDENVDRLKDIQIGAQVAERVLDEFKDTPEMFGNDRLGLSTMAEYYQYYFYQRKDEMMYRVSKDSLVGRDDDLFNLLSLNTLSVSANQRVTNSAPIIPFKQSFQTAAKAFYAIDSLTRGVIVPYSAEGDEIVKDLCGALEIEKQYKLIKRAQRYSVNMLPYELKLMAEKKAIREVQEGSGILYLDSQYYSDQFGWGDEIVNDMKPLIV